MNVDPDNIHLMIAEDNTNFFPASINSDYKLEYNDKILVVDLTKIIRGSSLSEEGRLIDANGDEIDRSRTKIQVSISPQDITMTDDIRQGMVDGFISNLIYKGDHYSYVIHTDLEQDFVVDDEYLWNMDDHVGLIMPTDKMSFTVKR